MRVNIPINWNLVLNQVGYETATIAGGSVRDFMCKKNVRDIDIFIQEQEYKDRHLREGVPALPTIPGYITPVRPMEPENQEYDPDFLVFEYFGREPGEIPIQLIFVPGRVLDHIRGFDMDLCKMWYRNNEFHMDKQAIWAMRNKIAYTNKPERALRLHNERGYDDFQFYNTVTGDRII